MGFSAYKPFTPDITEVFQDQEPVWEWNQLDTSQFEGSPAFEDPAIVSSTTLSVVSTIADVDQPYENALEIRHNPNTGNAFWLANATLSSLGLTDKNFLLHWVGVAVSSNARGGMAFLCDDTQANFFGYGLSFGNFMFRYRVDNGVSVEATDAQTIYPTGVNPVLGKNHVYARKPVAAPPEFITFNESRDSIRYSRRQRQSQWPSEPPPSSWDNLSCDRWGLVLGGSGNIFMQLAKLQMFEL